MKSSSKILLGIAALLVLIALGYLLLRPTAVPDQTQILGQMETARDAAEHHNVSGIMAVVSDKYQDSNIPSPLQLRYLLNKVQGSDPITVTATPPTVDVQGDAATSQTHLHVVSARDGRVLYDHDVTLHWQREGGTRLGVLPTKVWRVVSADYGGVSIFGIE